METITHIEVDISKQNSFRTVVAKQGDRNSRFLNARLVNNGEKFDVDLDASVLLNVEKSDLSTRTFLGVVNTDGTVTVPLEWWTLSTDGLVRCSISIIKNNDRLTTTSFTILVEKSECSHDYFGEEPLDIVALYSQVITSETTRQSNEEQRQTAELQREVAETQRNLALSEINERLNEKLKEKQSQIDTLFAINENSNLYVKAEVDEAYSLRQTASEDNELLINGSSAKLKKITGVTAKSTNGTFDGYKSTYFKSLTCFGKNLIPYPYRDTSKTENGITFTVDNNGVITANGTSENTAYFEIFNIDDSPSPIKLVAGKTYTLSCGVDLTSNNCGCYLLYGRNGQADGALYPKDSIGLSNKSIFWSNDYTVKQILLYVTENTTLDNLKIYPQLELELEQGETATEYQPYTESKVELETALDTGLGSTIDLENGKYIKQWNEIEFDGTETWIAGEDTTSKWYSTAVDVTAFGTYGLVSNLFNPSTDKGVYFAQNGDGELKGLVVRWETATLPSYMQSLESFKEYLGSNHLKIRYKTKDIQEETDLNINPYYTVYNGGTELVEQGSENANMEQANALTQEYYLKVSTGE